MKRFVASVALAWFLDDPVAPLALRVKQSLLAEARAVVRAHWHVEMANSLVVAERRRILTAADVTRSLRHLEQLAAQIETNSDFIPARPALTTACSFRLSAYDAV